MKLSNNQAPKIIWKTDNQSVMRVSGVKAYIVGCSCVFKPHKIVKQCLFWNNDIMMSFFIKIKWIYSQSQCMTVTAPAE